MISMPTTPIANLAQVTLTATCAKLSIGVAAIEITLGRGSQAPKQDGEWKMVNHGHGHPEPEKITEHSL